MGIETAILGSSLIGGVSSILGGRAAGNAISGGVGAANQGIYDATSSAQNYLTQGVNEVGRTLTPWQQLGPQGVNSLMGMDPNIGIDPYSDVDPNININPYSQIDPNIDVGPTPLSGSPDDVMSRFYTSPDYEFRRSEGLRDTSNMMNNTYGLGSGNALKALTEYNSNLASGEFGDWVNRAMADYGLNYGVASDNFARAYGQESDDFGRAYGQAADNFARAYGQESDDYNRAYGQAADNFTRGYGQASDLTNLGYGADMNWANTYGNFTNNLANNALNAGYGYAGNLMGGAGQQANNYLNTAAGINNAAQSGIGNWLYAQGRGLINQPSYGYDQTQPMYDFQGRPISYEI